VRGDISVRDKFSELKMKESKSLKKNELQE
jgi:hypothetical protein